MRSISSEKKPACTNIDVTSRHHCPLLVLGPKLPPHEISVSGVVERARSNGHQQEGEGIQDDEGRRDQDDRRACPERRVERGARRVPFAREVSEMACNRDGGASGSGPFRRRQDIPGEPDDHHQCDQQHEGLIVKTCARRPCEF